MRQLRNVILAILASAAMHAWASPTPQQRLLELFQRGEQCHLTDDYEQLRKCYVEYRDFLSDNEDLLGDSAEVYRAYMFKMYASYYYGKSSHPDDNNFNLSDFYYHTCFNIFKRRDDIFNLIKIREELAQLYYKNKDYQEAALQLDTIYNYYDEHVNYLGISQYEPQYYRTMSQQAICNARLGNFDLALSQIETAHDYFKKRKDENYYESLRRWGKILMMQADKQGATDYEAAKRCYERYVKEECAVVALRLDTMSSEHRSQHWLATHRFLYDCYRLGGHAPELLYDLALFSKGYLIAYESNRSAPQCKWRQVRKKLSSRDCAIEFVQYFGTDDQKRLGCLVLKNNGNPKFLDLFSTDSLLSLRLSSGKTVEDAFNATEAEVKDILYNDERLAKKIWTKQLMDAIGNADRVFFSPDGIVHQWAIEYLLPDSSKTCYRLSSTAVLVKRSPRPKMQSALLCGGILFNSFYNPSSKNNDYKAYRYLKPRVGTIKYLQFSKIEVDSIFACRNNPNDTLLTGFAAKDEGVVKLINSRHYDILHFSTHGHYIGNIDIQNDLKPLTEDISLSRSGLMFAGAAKTLADEQFDDQYSDAILSGKELSALDLSKTELVVLNACQTGLGRLTEDGTYGLQRALKQAGANAIMVSLWSINDYSSGLFLRFFYEELKKQPAQKIDIHAAFLAARNRLAHHTWTKTVLDETTLNFKKVQVRYDSPYHIDPLILIDAY